MKCSNLFLKIEYFDLTDKFAIIHTLNPCEKWISRKCSIFFLKIEYFKDISNLKENLDFSGELLGLLPVKSVGSIDKIG